MQFWMTMTDSPLGVGDRAEYSEGTPGDEEAVACL